MDDDSPRHEVRLRGAAVRTALEGALRRRGIPSERIPDIADEVLVLARKPAVPPQDLQGTIALVYSVADWYVNRFEALPPLAYDDDVEELAPTVRLRAFQPDRQVTLLIGTVALLLVTGTLFWLALRR